LIDSNSMMSLLSHRPFTTVNNVARKVRVKHKSVDTFPNFLNNNQPKMDCKLNWF